MKGNWLLGTLDDSELRKLISKGLAVQALRFVIPVLHAYSTEEYLSFIKKYISTGDKMIPKYWYFRGQNKDHFYNNRLQVLPPAYRSEYWQLRYDAPDPNRTEVKELKALLDPWEKCLRKEIGLQLTKGYSLIDDLSGNRRIFVSELPTDLVVNNMEFMAVLQHYGFPTPCLDVTKDPLIALWFALHRPHAVDDIVTYKALEPTGHWPADTTNSLWQLPSVYIFHEFPPGCFPTTNYGEFEWLNKITIRPHLQSAASLPFHTISLRVYERIGEVLFSHAHHYRYPVGVIKMHFPADQIKKQYAHLSQESIFPDDDHLHRVFCSIHPPHFIRYVSETHYKSGNKTESDTNPVNQKKR